MAEISQRENAPQRGRPVGTRKQYKAERRLARELADKQLRDSLARGGLTVLAELTRSAKSNPVTGLAIGIFTVDLLYRSGIISYTAAGAFYALFSVSAATEVIRSIAGAFPFSSDAEQRTAAQPTNATTVEGAAVIAEKGVIAKEFL